MNNLKDRLKKLEVLLETSEILNSKQDTDTILATLLEKSLDLIEGADAGAIFLYNEKNGLLEMRSFIGMDDCVKDVKLMPGESMTGITFAEKRAIFFANNEMVSKAMATMRSNNLKLAEEGTRCKYHEIHASICCPLIHRDKCIGVLVIDNLHNKVPFTNEDFELLKAISVQATIAIINAQNLEREIYNNKQLEKYNKIIENQKNVYKYSTNLHSRFTQMVLEGCTIDDIIAETKKLINKDVFIINLFYKVSHYCISSHETLEAVNKNMQHIIKCLKKRKKVRYYDSHLNFHFHIFPIMVNQEILSWLCIQSSSPNFSELDMITAERASTILALEFVRQNELSFMEQSLKGDFLDSLISNNNIDYIKKCSMNYGFNLNAKHRILIIGFEFQTDGDINEEKYQESLKNGIKYYYESIKEKIKLYFSSAISLIKRHTIVVIIETESRMEKNKIIKFITSLKAESQNLLYNDFKDLKYYIGISDVFDKIDKFGSSYHNALQIINIIKNYRMEKNYIFYEDLEVKKFLMNNDFHELQNFVNKIFGPLKDYKNASKKDFIETLKVYLRTNCNWSKTKDILRIHGNTLTYRIHKISEILDMDLDDYYNRLCIQVAYEIMDLLNLDKNEIAHKD